MARRPREGKAGAVELGDAASLARARRSFHFPWPAVGASACRARFIAAAPPQESLCRDSRCPRSAACHPSPDRLVDARNVGILMVLARLRLRGRRGSEVTRGRAARPLDPVAPNSTALPCLAISAWPHQDDCGGRRRRHATAGLDPKDFSAHGLRAGYLTEAARRGVALPEAAAVPALIRLAGGQLLQRRPSSGRENGEAWSLAFGRRSLDGEEVKGNGELPAGNSGGGALTFRLPLFSCQTLRIG